MDFYKICRLCALIPNSGSIDGIFSKDSDIIMMKIQACCPVEITIDDELPPNLCSNCNHKLNDFYNFRIQMFSADQKLKSLLEAGKLVKPVPHIKSELIKEETNDELLVPLDTIVGSETDQLDIELSADLKLKSLLEAGKLVKPVPHSKAEVIKEEPNDELLVPLDAIVGSETDQLDIQLSDEVYTSYGEEDVANSSDHSYCSDGAREDNKMKNKDTRRTTTVCPICGKEFRKDYYSIHMNNVHELGLTDTIHRCDICNRDFPTNLKLRRHKISHITHCCDKCDKTFKSLPGLLNHKKMFHLGKKDYVCKVCNKAFGIKTHLDHHLLQHIGETSYVCKLSPRSFTNDWNNTRPYTCELCEKTFVQKTDLKTHVKSKHS